MENLLDLVRTSRIRALPFDNRSIDVMIHGSGRRAVASFVILDFFRAYRVLQISSHGYDSSNIVYCQTELDFETLLEGYL